MINSIESSIIAYFDNRLSDAERVELLRQVNESDDARKLFRQHEVLRSLVQRAQARAVVDADTENLLLSKISPNAMRRTLVIRPRFFQAIPIVRTFAGVLAASALVFLGMYFFNPFLNRNERAIVQKTISQPIISALNPSGISGLASKQIHNVPSEIALVPKNQRLNSHVITSPAAVSVAMESATPTGGQISDCPIPESGLASSPDRLSSKNETYSLAPIPQSTSNWKDNIRLSLEADSPPINDRHFPGISGGTASIGYFISPSDIVSARFGYYASRLLPPIAENAFQSESGRLDDQFTSVWSAGLAVEHQIMAYDGRLIFSGALGAGFQTNGNYVSLNLSAVTPIGGNLLTGIGLSISHEHFSPSTRLVPDAASSTGVSLWTNSEVSNFVVAKIYYMVSYGF